MATTLDESLTYEGHIASMAHIFESVIEGIVHDLVLEVHREEKIARMQTAVLDLNIRAEKLGKNVNAGADDGPESEAVETKAAVAQAGAVQLRGNPLKQVKHTRCPNCRLPRLWYPRVGFNSRPPPDPTAQYCKTEPMIIIDKHDVHGQRKKGVKVKGQPKGKGKGNKLRESSPASSIGDPSTPQSAIPDSFEFKEIDYPAAKCPNRNSHLGDHWKAVNLFATHLNGSCWLKRDRAALREANAKLSGTPKDSRANSPKPTATNGTKRKADEKDSEPAPKKKQKMSETKKLDKKTAPQPSKLREQSTAGDDGDDSSVKGDPDTIQVMPRSNPDGEVVGKLKLTTSGVARKKPPKSGKKS
ncbi:hypothetical protein PMZ80_001943 [Knufia obscura]|uniref:Uncharacterized protein n=2 Tax=Knufia TaxID=430999 RepID=A0AAN8EU59_9EURO|nr:hypothetical protein PMZ80_001943 [Knufia obscura]KAK5953761.1 hypothetical protein OHC33_005030 [Knufia fluminis]